MSNKEFDYIIIGAGTAGCVLANRLSEDPSVSVCVIEAGGKDYNPLIHMPVGFSKMTQGPYTWGLTTAPQKHANNREIPYAQAKVVGGGSSINAEVFTRAVAEDYDNWAKDGAKGWDFASVKPYFIKSEGNTFFSGEHHGVDGELGVSNLPDPQEMTRAFIKSCQEAGMNYNPDFNDGKPAGAGIYQTTTKNCRRCSTAVGYLKPVLHRKNLTLFTKRLVNRILIENQEAYGVELDNEGTTETLKAKKEVIVACGAIGSPKLLMLSGVGPAAHLQEKGIDVLLDLAGVGQNLTDHFGIDIVAELKDHTSLDKYKKIHYSIWAGLQYILFNSGPIASNVVEGGAFWYSGLQGDEKTDLQFHFLAGAGAEAGVPGVTDGQSGITLNSYNLRPKSRGSVVLKSADPQDNPIVDPNFLADEADVRISIEGVKKSVEIFKQPSLSKYIKAIMFPDSSVQTDEDYIAYARKYGRTSYHPVGTCKMGDDDMSVVDSELRVRGINKLRVCDSSIMPNLIGSNTNAVTVMIAEKAADLIKSTH